MSQWEATVGQTKDTEGFVPLLALEKPWDPTGGAGVHLWGEGYLGFHLGPVSSMT